MNEELNGAVGFRFSGSYAEARSKFLAAAGHAVKSYAVPARGPDQQELFTDAVWFGDPDATRLAILISATHGVEGYCGAAAQLDWLVGGGPLRLRSGEAVLLVHAVNAYGFAWDRRVTFEGCDLNRNFVDFTAALPQNPGYDELAPHLVPSALDGDVLEAAEAAIRAFRAAHGELGFQTARKSGQYRHASGMFFGGVEPTSARQALETIVADFRVAARERVIIIDYHTGLGPYGYGELQCEQPSGMEGFERARRIFGHSVTSPDLGTSSSVALNGTQDEYWQRLLGGRHVYVCLEFGTYDPESSRRALRDDHWLHAYGTSHIGGPLADAIRQRVRDHYYPQASDWKEMVLSRSRQVQRQMIEGLRSM
jgi:hypothetical protein